MLAPLALALVASVPAPPPPLPPDPALLRLRAIEAALEAGEPAAQLWWSVWLFGLTAASAGQAALSFSVGDRAAPLFRVGAVRAGIGAASVLLVPLPAAFAPAALRAMPEGTGAERAAKRAAAEGWLRRSAAIERLGRSWVAHAGGLLVNTAASLWLWLREDRPASAAISFGIGLVVGEAKIFSQPTQAIDDERALLEETSSADAPARRASHVVWSLAPAPGGVVLAGRF